MNSSNLPPTESEVKKVLLDAVKGSLAQRPVGLSVEECFVELIMAVNRQHDGQVNALMQQYERERRHKLAAQDRLRELEAPGKVVIDRAKLAEAWNSSKEFFECVARGESFTTREPFEDLCGRLGLPEK